LFDPMSRGCFACQEMGTFLRKRDTAYGTLIDSCTRKDDPPDSATYIAHVMTLGGPALPAGVVSRIVRINPLVSLVTKPLCNIDMDAVVRTEVNAISAYADLRLGGNAPNERTRAARSR
jgi:hypothetical protein